jgi:hypothetical protein
MGVAQRLWRRAVAFLSLFVMDAVRVLVRLRVGAEGLGAVRKVAATTPPPRPQRLQLAGILKLHAPGIVTRGVWSGAVVRQNYTCVIRSGTIVDRAHRAPPGLAGRGFCHAGTWSETYRVLDGIGLTSPLFRAVTRRASGQCSSSKES